MANTITQGMGCWIQYQLKLNGYTHETVAKEADLSTKIVSHFLTGRKDSVRVRMALCKVLGYENFKKLAASAPKDVRLAREKGGAA
jgi:hypothetical protein